MFSLLVALTAASAVQAPAAAPARSLQSIPGVTIKYYDVSGYTDGAVKKSIASQRPKAADGSPIPAGTSWDIGAGIQKRTEGSVCTTTAAKVTFKGMVELPRLVEASAAKPEFLQNWNKYVAELESAAASDLGFISDNLAQIEKALVGIPCDKTSDTLNTATAGLKAQQQAFAKARAAQAAAAAAAAKASAAAAAKAEKAAKDRASSGATRY